MSTRPTTIDPPVPRWLHAWAVLTACAALPLVLLGAEVTTKQVGMVDPQSVRVPWHLFTIPVAERFSRGLGYLIEHGHRTFGWLVGACAIVLALGLWFGARRSRVRWLGWLTLAMVSVQGVLGIFRVKLNALAGTDLALVHGLFAQLVVATLVGVAVVTSRGWRQRSPVTDGAGLRRLAGLLALFVYLQIAFGAVVRHFHTPLAQRLHVLLAFAVVAITVWLVRSVWDRGPRRVAGLFVALLILQVALGVEAWMGRFGAGVPVEALQSRPGLDAVRSAHFLVGTLLFSCSVALNLLLYRPVPGAEPVSDISGRPIEGRHTRAVAMGGVA
jgi:heme A synthase